MIWALYPVDCSLLAAIGKAISWIFAPCFAAMGAINREMNSAKWTFFAIGYQCVFAYVIALIVNNIGSIFLGSVNVAGIITAVILLAVIVFLLVRPYKKCDRLRTKIKA